MPSPRRHRGKYIGILRDPIGLRCSIPTPPNSNTTCERAGNLYGIIRIVYYRPWNPWKPEGKKPGIIHPSFGEQQKKSRSRSRIQLSARTRGAHHRSQRSKRGDPPPLFSRRTKENQRQIHAKNRSISISKEILFGSRSETSD
ncbi:hypothetical protein BDP81DRAFT_116755 [Colletotrichum phormii]|uniref:Uncharacterized protein n=1 Tax=Colletotrichum phormii TaxID=359342 RepID=A0AAI9ZFQ2_9PEZI|nr:uncharacterized protein BDP81DRAFT_116755 [Colletotrichum phormii]KAK1623723.1 hypothetical protein BDP81DRAFT_116755 [Colletotrichum phormii]